MDRPTRAAARAAALATLVPVLLATVAACGGTTATTRPSPSTSAVASPTTVPAATGTPSPTPVPVATGTPLGDRLVAMLTVDTAPCAMAVDATSVWITGSADGLVDRIDPATNSIVATATTGGAPCGIAIGSDGRVWVAVLGTGEVVAIDPATNAVTDRISGVGPALWDLKAGFGAIWVSDRNAKQVLRIDPETAAIVKRIDVGPKPAGLAVLADGVWLADEVDGQLRRIDPATNEVAATIAASGTPTWFSDDGQGVLLISERGLSRVRIVDRAGGALTNPTKGWREPLDGTVFAGRAWIPDGGARRLGVIDLAAPDAEPVRYALPGAVNPFVAEPAFGDIWVLDFSGTTVWRIRP
jgi:streptogramin lyase